MKLITLYDFQAEEESELPLKKNDIITLIEDHGDWLKVSNKTGQTGLIPVLYVAGPVESDAIILCRGKLKQAHKASSNGELSLDKASQVAVLGKDDDYWWYVGYSGKTGYIPKHIIMKITEKKNKVVAIAPEKAMCDENVPVLFSFQKALQSEGEFMTIFKGESCEKVVDTERLNDYTLRVITPKYYPAECVKVTITHQKLDSSPEIISQSLAFAFQSKLDVVHTILKKESDPMSLLCSSFKVEHGDVRNFDHILSGLLEKKIPEGFDVFKSKSSSIQGEAHSKEIPSLLHFAAFYNLKKLTRAILQCPGASQALQERNCEGMTPFEVAQFKRHGDLELILEDHQTTETDESGEIYERMEKIYEEYIKMDDVEDELYEDMAGSHPSTDEEHYVEPRPKEDKFENSDKIDDIEHELGIKKGRMSEKDLQVALLVKRVKERYITHDQALEMAKILRLEPEVTTATRTNIKPKSYKKKSAPVMDELCSKLKSLPRTCSTSSGSSMSSMGSTSSGSSTSGQVERPNGKTLPPLPPIPQAVSPRRTAHRTPPPVSQHKQPIPAPRRPPR